MQKRSQRHASVHILYQLILFTMRQREIFKAEPGDGTFHDPPWILFSYLCDMFAENKGKAKQTKPFFSLTHSTKLDNLSSSVSSPAAHFADWKLRPAFSCCCNCTKFSESFQENEKRKCGKIVEGESSRRPETSRSVSIAADVNWSSWENRNGKNPCVNF